MPDTLIVVPTAGGDDDALLRRQAFKRVMEHLSPLGWPVVVATDDHRPFRLAHTVNEAVRANPCRTFLLNHADVLVPHDQIRAAVAQAATVDGQVFPFDEYVDVGTPDGVEVVHENAPSNACVAMRRDWFLRMGGYDENLEGWAPDDQEFNWRCLKAGFPPFRLPGRLEHLWHGERWPDHSTKETDPALVAWNRAYVRDKISR